MRVCQTQRSHLQRFHRSKRRLRSAFWAIHPKMDGIDNWLPQCLRSVDLTKASPSPQDLALEFGWSCFEAAQAQKCLGQQRESDGPKKPIKQYVYLRHRQDLRPCHPSESLVQNALPRERQLQWNHGLKSKGCLSRTPSP